MKITTKNCTYSMTQDALRDLQELSQLLGDLPYSAAIRYSIRAALNAVKQKEQAA